MADFMKELIAFAREKGYIWGPSPEIYGGVSGFYTYGPLGKLLKNNVEDKLRQVFNTFDFWEVECPTILPRKVWEASGHIGGFSDPLIKDIDGNFFRADHVIEECLKKMGKDPDVEMAGKTTNNQLLALIKDLCIVAPNGKALIPEILDHNLLMPTRVGVDTEVFIRGETATATYLPYQRYFDYFRKKLPYGVFQIGKAYRNEISPRQFTLRMREFTQAEAQLFLFKDQKDNYPGFARVKTLRVPVWSWEQQKKKEQPKSVYLSDARAKYMKNDAYATMLGITYELFLSVGIPEERIRLRQHGPSEKAFYAEDAWDVEVNLKSFGWTEMCGVHDRTDYDLKQHAEFSGKNLMVSDEIHKNEFAHVLEIAFGTDRMVFVLLDLLFDPASIEKGKTTFRIPYSIAPIKAAIYPLVKKDNMPDYAREIHAELTKEFVCVYDQAGSIGRRYLRAAEMGIPYCITVDGDTIKDGTVTIRDRDTEEQKRVKKDELGSTLHELLSGKKKFADL